MSDVSSRIRNLSPEKLDLLSRRLAQRKLYRQKPIPRRAVHGESAALSFAQERLWFLNQVDPGSSAYSVVGAVDLLGRLDMSALQGALNEIVQRHETLRTTFRVLDGKPLQIISRQATVEVQSEAVGSDESALVEQWVGEKVRQPFDLTTGPLLRIHLGRIRSDRHVLVTLMHHIVSDGPSMNLYFRELVELYASTLEGRSPDLLELPVQYSDFAVWQREVLSEGILDEQLMYWKTQLAGIRELPAFPVDYPRSPVVGLQLAFQSADLPPAMVESFKTMVGQQLVTPFIGVLAAFQVVLHYFSGLGDIVVGSPVTGRTRQELEKVIGLFANLHILRTDLTGDPSFRELLSRTRRVVAEAQDHQEVPFQKVIEALQPARELGKASVFQVSFTYVSDFEQLPHVPGLRVTPLRPVTGDAMYDLDLNLVQQQGTLTATFEYKKALFDAGTIAGFLRALDVAMAVVTANPDVRLSQLCHSLKKAEEDRALALVKEREEKLRAKVMNAGRKVLQSPDRKRSNP